MAGEHIDYYGLLEVDPGADQRAIRSAYRRLARRFHPDVATGEEAARRFLLIREAYEVLSDPESRRRYDRRHRNRPPGRRPAGAQEPPSDRGAGPAAASSTSGGGLRFVLDLLGVRIEAGLSADGPSRRRPPER